MIWKFYKNLFVFRKEILYLTFIKEEDWFPSTYNLFKNFQTRFGRLNELLHVYGIFKVKTNLISFKPFFFKNNKPNFCVISFEVLFSLTVWYFCHSLRSLYHLSSTSALAFLLPLHVHIFYASICSFKGSLSALLSSVSSVSEKTHNITRLSWCILML